MYLGPIHTLKPCTNQKRDTCRGSKWINARQMNYNIWLCDQMDWVCVGGAGGGVDSTADCKISSSFWSTYTCLIHGREEVFIESTYWCKTVQAASPPCNAILITINPSVERDLHHGGFCASMLRTVQGQPHRIPVVQCLKKKRKFLLWKNKQTKKTLRYFIHE